jgi:hypothetical protein
MEEDLRRMGEILQRQSRFLRGERAGELRGLTEAELIEKHDALVEESAMGGLPP